MNNRYFACPAVHSYVDAGYRWAYWMLEHPGIVQLSEKVNIESVLDARDYWNPNEDEVTEWLAARLSLTRNYLEQHRDDIFYIDEDYLITQWELGHDWKKVESL